MQKYKIVLMWKRRIKRICCTLVTSYPGIKKIDHRCERRSHCSLMFFCSPEVQVSIEITLSFGLRPQFF